MFRDMPPTRTARFATPLHRKIPLPLPFYGEFLGGVILVFHVFLEILNPLYLEKLFFRFNDMSYQSLLPFSTKHLSYSSYPGKRKVVIFKRISRSSSILYKHLSYSSYFTVPVSHADFSLRHSPHLVSHTRKRRKHVHGPQHLKK